MRVCGRQRPQPWRASGSALGIAQGGTVDPDGVALMAQPTEESVDERFVAEKRLPFRVIEVECPSLQNATRTPFCAVFGYGCLLDLDGGTDVAAACRQFGFTNPTAGRSLADLRRDVPLFV